MENLITKGKGFMENLITKGRGFYGKTLITKGKLQLVRRSAYRQLFWLRTCPDALLLSLAPFRGYHMRGVLNM